MTPEQLMALITAGQQPDLAAQNDMASGPALIPRGTMPPAPQMPEPSWQDIRVGDRTQAYPGEADEIPTPKDFWTRLAEAQGPEPLRFQARNPNAAEVILGLAAAFSNFKTASAGNKARDIEKQNERVRQSARDLALHRYQLKRQRELRADIAAAQAAKPYVVQDAQGNPIVTTSGEAPGKPGLPKFKPPETPEQVGAKSKATTKGRIEAYTESGLPVPGTTGGKGAAPKPSTMAERTALGFYHRALDQVNTVQKPDANGSSLENRIAHQNSIRQLQGQKAMGWLQTNDQRAYRAAQRRFTEARLRKESGAAINPTEYETDARMYFYQPGDDAKTMADKVKARETVLNNLKFQSGKAYTEYYNGQQPDGGGGEGKIVVVDPNGKPHEFDTQEQADRFKKLAGIN